MKFSVIIPAYNEGEAISSVLDSLKRFLRSYGVDSEILVVNDGSTDKTAEILKNIEGIRVLNHPHNKGYGAALKTGINNSSNDWVIFFDADGQFNPEEIKKLMENIDGYDMVVGARVNKKAPLIRAPGRGLLHFLANYLSDRKIPDLNSGFRLVKKDKLRQFWHLLPDSFSFSTTTTLAFHKSGLNIKYIPVHINKRNVGKSSVGPRHAIKMFFLILKTITLFSPLRVFMPVFIFLFLSGLGFLVYDLTNKNLGDSTVLLFVASIIVFLFALLADQIAAIRQELRRQD